MNSAAEPEPRRSEPDRTQAFSDGVFAIAITLLVLELRVPAHEPGHLVGELLQLWPGYLAFLASFLYIGVIWLNHQAAFRRIRFVDRGLSWANLGLLLFTSLLPFPTAVLSDAFREGNPSDSRTAVLLYAFVGVLLAMAWLVFFHYLHRNTTLSHEHVDKRVFTVERHRAIAGMAAYAVAGLLGLATPVAALGLFLILPVFYGITSEGVSRRAPPHGIPDS